MHELPLLINITIALVVAFCGGVLARRIGLPSIVGYLLAGIAIGPFTPGFVGDLSTIQQLAEMGVIFLMLGVGLHFNFQDLWRVRDIAIPGSILQTAISTILGWGISQIWGWDLAAGIVFGLAISVASTVVTLRGLIDHQLLNSSHGQATVGWLVMEDIISVILLVFMPVLSSSGHGFQWQLLVVTVLKAAAFILIMFVGGTRLIPRLLNSIAHTHSRELFILAILAITLGTALGAAKLFGVSLALGAFVAGAIISQSHLSHQVEADVLPFRESFAVLFFVSVGMLVNPFFLWQNIGPVLSVTAFIVLGKILIVLFLGLIFPRSARTFLVVAVGLCQIGEFSFILGQEGMALNLLSGDQYSLILAGSLFSITLNPFMYRFMPDLERWLKAIPGIWQRMDGVEANVTGIDEHIADHVVVVSSGQIGTHLMAILELLKVPHLVIENEMERIAALSQRGIPTLYGEASNPVVLEHAGLKHARVLVVTTPDEISTELVVIAAKDINPNLPIIARAMSEDGLRHLVELGAHHVVFPEMEGGLEIVHDTLIELGFSAQKVHDYSDAVRRDGYDIQINTVLERSSLYNLLAEKIQGEFVASPEGEGNADQRLQENNGSANQVDA